MEGGQNVGVMGTAEHKHTEPDQRGVIATATLEYFEKLNGAFLSLHTQSQPIRVKALSGSLAALAANIGGMGGFTLQEISLALQDAADSMATDAPRQKPTVQLKGNAQRKVNWEA